jgi:anti-sigma regulatory factor (Ser/Thr protein kinase)
MMSRSESNSDRMECRLQGSGAIRRAIDAARTFGEAHQLSDDDLARFCIVIEELVANLYDHGGLTEIDEVELSFHHEPGGIRASIFDPGTPFDPRSAMTKRERPKRGGGAGIDLTRSWAQLIDYQVTPEGNRLDLLLPIGHKS